MFWVVLFLLFGFYLLVKSADILVDGAAGLGKRYKIPKLVVGLTLVAFGTSAPEGAVSLIAAMQGSPNLSIGNVLGSNLANIALVLAVAAIIKTLPVTRTTLTKGIPLNILALVALIILGYDSFFQNHFTAYNRLSFGDGLILLIFFVICLYYIFGDLKATQVQEEEIEKKERSHFDDKLWFLGLMIVGGLAGLLVGGKLVVDNAVHVARFFGVSEALIGLTIVALGTSLPEFATSVAAAVKNEKDIAIGNIVGSNVFNVFLVLGLTSTVSSMDFDPMLMFDAVFALGITIIFYFLLVKGRQLTKVHGYILLVLYVLYLASLGSREILLAAFRV